MSTTTIRLPEELKARVAQAAKRAGTTSHSFILEAIAARTEALERRNDFHDEAKRRWEEFQATGESVPWSEMREYLIKRAAGEPAQRPVPRKAGT